MPGLWVRDRSITCGSFGKCLRFPVTKKESFESLRLPLAKGSSTSNQAFSIVFTTPSVPLVGDRNLRRKDATALRCSEPLRSKVGGASKPSPYFAGWDRMGIAVYSLQLIVYSLRLISWLFADNLQISCGFLGGFEKKRNFGGKLYKLNNNVIFRNGLMIMTRMDWNIDL